jgi:2-polyprenyl-6-methoxyphenol hydroxylase-like FAD-dependent oxidoreductase
MPQFVVVGAGPAGCSAALKAARLPEAQVKVIEKRTFESVFSTNNNPRSYPMVLSGRALGLFEDLGLDLPSIREPYHGIEFLPSKGTLKFPSASF